MEPVLDAREDIFPPMWTAKTKIENFAHEVSLFSRLLCFLVSPLI